MLALAEKFRILTLRYRYHKGVFTRMANTIGVEFLTKKVLLPDLPAIKA